MDKIISKWVWQTHQWSEWQNQGTNSIQSIPKCNDLKNRGKVVTYCSIACNAWNEKDPPNQSWFTIGGDKIKFPGEVPAQTVDILVAKILFNSAISTGGARFLTMDTSNFYLMTLLLSPQYLQMTLADLPEKIIKEYKPHGSNNEWTDYIKVIKGRYSLPQAGILTNELLEKWLNKNSYYLSTLVLDLWKHKTSPISFTLVVDNFGVKYINKQHAEHFMSVLKEHYTVIKDWSGKS